MSGSFVDESALRRAIESVLDPELGRPIGELGLIEECTVRRDGRVHAVLSHPFVGAPLVETLRRDAEAVLLAQPGVRRAEVEVSSMEPRHRVELAARLRAERGSGPVATTVYAVASGKGGVGKSTVAANLATALAAEGKRVGLLDADVWGWSVPQLFGVRRNPLVLDGAMLPILAHGVRLMSVGFIVAEDQPVVWRGPMLQKAIEQFLGDVLWGRLDVLLLDLPPGTGDVPLTVLELLPDAGLLVVTTPQPAAAKVARRVGQMAAESRMPIAGVVETMSELVCDGCGTSTALFGTGGGESLASILDTPLLGRVPLDISLRAAGDSGVPAVVAAPASAASLELTRIAARLPSVRRSLAGRQLPLSVV